jgi:3',5'-cyclic AMP phosphodiesterase CpdA
VLIAQISDLHIQERPGPDGVMAVDHLERAIDGLNRFEPRPDLVLVTGDLANNGRPAEYAMLRAAIGKLEIPYLLIAGNHDSREPLREAFPEHTYLRSGGEFIQYVDDTWPVRIVALDTTVPGRHHGVLCPARLQWLSDRLAEKPGQPTLVIMHHPPFDTGIRPMDALGVLEGREEFARIIGRHSNIERVLCGHMHRSIVCRVGNTLASTCPGTAHQVELDLRDAGRLTSNAEPPGYHVHWVRPGATVTHHAVVGHLASPFSPPGRPKAKSAPLGGSKPKVQRGGPFLPA